MSKKVKSFQTIFKELELMHEMSNAEVINCIIVAFFSDRVQYTLNRLLIKKST